MTFFKRELVSASKNSPTKTREKTVQLLDLPHELLFKIADKLELPHLVSLRKVAALNGVFFNQIFQQDNEPIVWVRYLQLINFANQQLFYNLALQYKNHILNALKTTSDLQGENHVALLLPIANQNNPQLVVSDDLFNELIPPFTVKDRIHTKYITSLALSLLSSLSSQQINTLFMALIDKKTGSLGYNYEEKITLFMALLPKLNTAQIAQIPVDFYLQKFHQYKNEKGYLTNFILTMNFLVYLSTKIPKLNFNITTYFEFDKQFKKDFLNKQREAVLASMAKYIPVKITELLHNLLSRLEHKDRHERKVAWVTLPLLVPYLNDRDVRSTLAVVNNYLDNEHKPVRETGLNILSALIPRMSDKELEHIHTKVRDKLNAKGELVRKAALNTTVSLTKRLPKDLSHTYLQPIIENLSSENIFVRLAALNASTSVLDQFDAEQIEILFKEFIRSLHPENLNILKKILRPIILASRFNGEQINRVVMALLTLFKAPKLQFVYVEWSLNQMIHDALIILIPHLSQQQHRTIFDEFMPHFRQRDKNIHRGILNTLEKQALFITDPETLIQIIRFIRSVTSERTVHTSTKIMALNIYTKLMLDSSQIYSTARECLLPLLAEPNLRNNAVRVLSVLVASLNKEEHSNIIDDVTATLTNLMSVSDSKALDSLFSHLPDEQLSDIPNILKSNATKKNESWKSWGVLIQRLNPSQLEEVSDFCVEHVNDENIQIVTNVFNYFTLCIPMLNDKQIDLVYEVLIPNLKARVSLYSDHSEIQTAVINTLTALTPKLTLVKTEQIATIYLYAIKDRFLTKQDWEALSVLATKITDKQLITSILSSFLQAAGYTMHYPGPGALCFNLLNILLPKLDPEQLIQVLNADYRENLQELSNTLTHFIMSGNDQGNALIQVMNEQKSMRNSLIQTSVLTLSEWFGMVATAEPENDLEESELPAVCIN
ncbi:MAG: hypothetical protein P4L79_14000 [Legionella sp.]|uniref:hypothetical protein n=1 Tax=Legionella sp. TaxID=459 RepID=UPI00284A9C45|nr:hypothetical protein [Legionella sp.]